jgi:molybdopterin synthase sulfur carrier subunit
MIITFYATLRDIIGCRTLNEEPIEGMTLRGLLESLMLRYPGLGKEMRDESGQMPGRVLIFINGRDQSFLPDQLETALARDDVLGIFPPIGGG